MPKLIAANLTKQQFENIISSKEQFGKTTVATYAPYAGNKKAFQKKAAGFEAEPLVEPSTLCMYGMEPSQLPLDYVHQEELWQDQAVVQRFYAMAYGMMETIQWTLVILAIVFCGVGICIAQFVDDAADTNYDMDLTGIAFMTIFVMEVSARVFVVDRLFGDACVFFKNPFNCLDMFATIVDVIINILASLANYGTFGRTTRTLRILRILRLLRLVRLLRVFRLLYLLYKKHDAIRREEWNRG